VIQADHSAWAQSDRASGSAVDLRISALIESGGPLSVTPQVVMEVLAAARTTQQAATLRRLPMRIELLRIDAVTDFDGPVHVCRRGRRVGITPQGMIASVAWRHRLLAQDIDPTGFRPSPTSRVVVASGVGAPVGGN